jgi:alpha 1,3-glucosidase
VIISKEDIIEFESEDEDLKTNFHFIDQKLNSLKKNKYSLCFKIAGGNFVVDYLVNNSKFLTLNSSNTLHLTKPTTISFDVTFHQSLSLYGLPLRMTELALKPNDNQSGYRLFNLDCAEHIPGHFQSLYGSIPIVHSLSTSGENLTSLFYPNARDTWIDLAFQEGDAKSLKFISEGGKINLFFYSDNNWDRLFYKQALITGFAKLPPLFSLGYHQCRWSYMNQGEVDDLIVNFEKLSIPYDVIWLDIDVKFLLK